MGVFTTKPVDKIIAESSPEYSQLRRSIGLVQTLALGIGSIIGAGVYTLMTEAAAKHAGPAVSLSFVLAAIACGFAGLCYAELASTMPVAGSAYTSAYATMGELLAWILGWDLILEYSIGAATAAASWSYMWRSLARSIRLPAPNWSTLDIMAVLIIALISFVLVAGIRESARFTTVVVVFKIGVMIAFALLGARTIKLSNYSNFIPANTGQFGEFGWSGILRAAGILYFAYIGFDLLATTAEEQRNPGRDIPHAIIGSLTICTFLYAAFALVLVGNINYTQLGASVPLSQSYEKLFSRPFALVLSAGTLLGLTSAILVMLLGQSRIIFAMARDGLLPSIFGRIHQRRRTPIFAQLAGMIMAGIAAAIVPLKNLAELTSIGTLFSFTVVCFAVLVLRQTHPNLPRPFRVPLVPLLPLTGGFVNVGLMIGLGSSNWLRLVLWLLLGLVVYSLYGKKHSHLGTNEGG